MRYSFIAKLFVFTCLPVALGGCISDGPYNNRGYYSSGSYYSGGGYYSGQPSRSHHQRWQRKRDIESRSGTSSGYYTGSQSSGDNNDSYYSSKSG